MTIEFIGYAGTREYSESMGFDAGGPVVDPEYVGKVARTHEASGFDKVLIAHSSSSPDGFVLADQVLSRSHRLAVLLAHRPGFLSPTLAAHMAATYQRISGGRLLLNVVTGGDDVEQRIGDEARERQGKEVDALLEEIAPLPGAFREAQVCGSRPPNGSRSASTT